MIPTNSITIIWKIVYRNWLFWFSMIIGIAHLFLLFNQYFFEEHTFNIGNSLVMSSFIVQGGILLFMFLGIHLQNIENEINLKEHLKTFKPKTWNTVDMGKFIFVSLLIKSIMLSAFIFFSLFIIVRGFSLTEFFIDSYLYIVLFWGASFFISCFVGMILSNWINDKSVYIFAILVSLLLGPLNTFFGDFKFLTFLNIGQPDYSYSYNPLYGYPLDMYYIFKKWLILTFLILIYYSSNVIKQGKLRINNFFTLMILLLKLIVLLWIFNNTPEPVSFTFDSKSKSYQEISYYQEDARILDQQDLIVESYDIDLSLTPLSVSLDMVIKNTNDTSLNTIHLSLYHQLQVRNIKVDGQELEFTQEKDYIRIKLKEKLQPKQSIMLHIEYNGESSPFYMVNNQAAYLPANFNWLPSVTVKPSITIEDNTLHRNSTEPSHLVSYELSIKGEEKIYTNLEKINAKKYSGVSNGLTIIAGQLTQRKIDDTNVILPLAWTLVLDGFKDLQNEIEGMLKELSNLTGNKVDLPKTIMILPITDVYDFLMQENYWLFDNHIILGYEPNSPMTESMFTSHYHKQYLFHSLVSAATWKQDKLISKNLEIPILFDASFAHWYHQKNAWNIEDSYFINLFSTYEEESIKSMKKEVVGKVKTIMSTDNFSHQYHFLEMWYNLQIKTNEMDWGLLSKIADEFIEGG